MNLDGLIYNLRNAAHFNHEMMLVPKEDVEEAIQQLKQYKKQKLVNVLFVQFLDELKWKVVYEDGELCTGNLSEVFWNGWENSNDERLK